LSICDRIVELGPEGGAGGGRVIASGTPEEIVGTEGSVTGPFLARDLGRAPKRKRSNGRRRVQEASP
jgi:excinuclease ABC subunit A